MGMKVYGEGRGGFDRPSGNKVMNPRFAEAFFDFKDFVDAEPLTSSERDFAYRDTLRL